jgi:hypothetical protein
MAKEGELKRALAAGIRPNATERRTAAQRKMLAQQRHLQEARHSANLMLYSRDFAHDALFADWMPLKMQGIT